MGTGTGHETRIGALGIARLLEDVALSYKTVPQVTDQLRRNNASGHFVTLPSNDRTWLPGGWTCNRPRSSTRSAPAGGTAVNKMSSG